MRGFDVFALYLSAKPLYTDIKYFSRFESVPKIVKLALPLFATFTIGMKVLPYMPQFIFISMVADIAIGAVEYLYHRYHEADRQSLKQLAYTKMVLAPARQFLFLAKLISYKAELLFQESRAIFQAIYGVRAKACLEAILKHRQGIIAVVKGELMSELTSTPNWYQQYQAAREAVSLFEKDFTILTEDVQASSLEWSAFIDKAKADLALVTEGAVGELAVFKAKVDSGHRPHALLENPSTLREAKRNYLEWSRKIHPDMHSNSRLSTILFSILKQAYVERQNNFTERGASRSYALDFCRAIIPL